MQVKEVDSEMRTSLHWLGNLPVVQRSHNTLSLLLNYLFIWLEVLYCVEYFAVDLIIALVVRNEDQTKCRVETAYIEVDIGKFCLVELFLQRMFERVLP